MREVVFSTDAGPTGWDGAADTTDGTPISDQRGVELGYTQRTEGAINTVCILALSKRKSELCAGA